MDPETTPPAAPPAPVIEGATPPAKSEPPATGEQEIDWKAHARDWEKKAKANNKAADELEKFKQAAMTDQEKAVAEAEQRGRSAVLAETGKKLAAAEFRAAAATAGVNLGDAADLIDTSKFVDDKGDVDSAAITAAVKKLAQLAPKAPPGRSGGDNPGGPGEQQKRPTSLTDAVRRSYG